MSDQTPELFRKTKTRRQRFLDVAQRRTTRVLTAIHALGACSNKAAYQYSDEDTDKIFGAIEAQLRQTQERFSKPPKKKEVEFKLAE